MTNNLRKRKQFDNMEPEGDRAFRLLFCVMDPVVISALIAAASAMLINIITNVILSSRQTALLEYRIKQLEDMLTDIRELPGRIITLETKMEAVEEALREIRS